MRRPHADPPTHLRAGHYACRRQTSKPPRVDLQHRQPGSDGSTDVQLPGGCDFETLISEMSEEARDVLGDVVQDLAEHLMLKAQHRWTNTAFNNILGMWMKSRHVAAAYKECLEHLAPHFNRALSLVEHEHAHVSGGVHGRMGAWAHGCMLRRSHAFALTPSSLRTPAVTHTGEGV
jgi:hypothetical protein